MNFQQFSNIIKHPIFLVMWLGLAAYSYYYIDLKLATLIHDAMVHHQHDAIKNIFQFITQLGNSSIYLTLSLLLILFALFRKPSLRAQAKQSSTEIVSELDCFACARNDGERLHQGVFIFFATAITGIACNIIKMLAGRARPVEFFSHDLYGFYFWQFHSSMWSFPSGHATIITAVATAFSLLLPRFWGIFFGIVLLVDASRVILLAHFVSDVMIGSYLGFIITDWLYYRFYCFNIARNTNGKIPPFR